MNTDSTPGQMTGLLLSTPAISIYYYYLPEASICYTIPWYKGRTLRRPRHGSKGVQTVHKAVQ